MNLNRPKHTLYSFVSKRLKRFLQNCEEAKLVGDVVRLPAIALAAKTKARLELEQLQHKIRMCGSNEAVCAVCGRTRVLPQTAYTYLDAYMHVVFYGWTIKDPPYLLCDECSKKPTLCRE